MDPIKFIWRELKQQGQQGNNFKRLFKPKNKNLFPETVFSHSSLSLTMESHCLMVVI